MLAYVSGSRRNGGRSRATPGDQAQRSCEAARRQRNDRAFVDPAGASACPQNSTGRRPLSLATGGRRGLAPASAVQAGRARAEKTGSGGPPAADLTLHVDNRRRDQNTRT